MSETCSRHDLHTCDVLDARAHAHTHARDAQSTRVEEDEICDEDGKEGDVEEVVEVEEQEATSSQLATPNRDAPSSLLLPSQEPGWRGGQTGAREENTPAEAPWRG
eukprot:3403857-Pyramimonas_sp.AAC.1